MLLTLTLLLACTKNGKVDTAVVAAAGCAGCSDEALQTVADVPLPGDSVRFDYQDLDAESGRLVIAHMNDDAVVVVDLNTREVLANVEGVPTARGVAVAPEADRYLVTSSPDQVVSIDAGSLTVVDTFTVGRSPDGLAWDPDHEVIGVSDQGAGALSLLAEAGAGENSEVSLGDATGNVRYDPSRGWFWITVEQRGADDQLIAVDPTSGAQEASFDLPGCDAAHGLLLHPDAASAFVACEDNDVLARVDLSTGELSTGETGRGPDVLSLDAGRGWLYVAAESGTLTVFDLNATGVSRLYRQSLDGSAHTVQVDPSTGLVYLPLEEGADGAPVLRIMQPVAR